MAADPADAEFWAAVEQEDVSALTSALGTDENSVAAVLPALSSWRRSRKDRSTVDSWRYRVSWSPVGTVPQRSLSGTWLLVGAEGHDHDTDEVADALSGQGAAVTRLVLDGTCVDRAVLAERLAGAGEITGVVSTLAPAEEPDERTPVLPLGLALTVSLVQALGDAGIEAPLWFLTRGAVSTGRSDEITSPTQALVTGVGWTTALEHPQRWGGVVDLPRELDQRAAGRLASALSGALGDEDQLAVRASGVFTRRIVRAAAGGGQGPARDWTPRGTTLLTGGSGTLAPHLARWLAGRGAEHLVLMSRRGADAPGVAELVAELTASGTQATAVACDVTDRDAVAALLAQLKAEGRTVRTVVHTAALIELYSLAETTMDAFSRVLDAKVTGARVLDELLDHEDLDDLILYSSTAGMWGSGARRLRGRQRLPRGARRPPPRPRPARHLALLGHLGRRHQGRPRRPADDPPQRPGVHGPAAGAERTEAGPGRRRDGRRGRRRRLGDVPPRLHLQPPHQPLRRDPRGPGPDRGRRAEHRHRGGGRVHRPAAGPVRRRAGAAGAGGRPHRGHGRAGAFVPRRPAGPACLP